MTSRTAPIVLAALATLSGSAPAIAGHGGSHNGGNRSYGRPDMSYRHNNQSGNQYRQAPRLDNQRHNYDRGRDYGRDNHRSHHGHGIFSGGWYFAPQYNNRYYGYNNGYNSYDGYSDYGQRGIIIETETGADCYPSSQPVDRSQLCISYADGSWRPGW